MTYPKAWTGSVPLCPLIFSCCDLTFCDQYRLCYIEVYEVQHPPVKMDKNIKRDLNSVISTVYVTSNCMRRNTHQFRWIKILSAILNFVISQNSNVYVTSNCIRRNTRQFRWIKILSAILNFVISTVHVTPNCMRRNTRQFRWTKILSAILIL